MKREKGKKADQMGKWPGGQKCRKNGRNQAGEGEKEHFCGLAHLISEKETDCFLLRPLGSCVGAAGPRPVRKPWAAS
ncbi:unnamed protein product [Amoebophrya sp. A120]|nr:unnamed protein product [Amoebophrya sp. A120]|eukprot:GSA120T00025927001.1